LSSSVFLPLIHGSAAQMSWSALADQTSTYSASETRAATATAWLSRWLTRYYWSHPDRHASNETLESMRGRRKRAGPARWNGSLRARSRSRR